MIPWKTEEPTSRPIHTLTIGPCHISVRERGDGKPTVWQSIQLCVGEFSTDPLDECLESWPRKAVRMLHQAARELEQRLKELEQDP